ANTFDLLELDPIDFEPVESAPVEPALVKPAPVEAAPAEAAPAEAAPVVEPAPVEASPILPTPADVASSMPEPEAVPLGQEPEPDVAIHAVREMEPLLDDLDLAFVGHDAIEAELPDVEALPAEANIAAAEDVAPEPVEEATAHEVALEDVRPVED